MAASPSAGPVPCCDPVESVPDLVWLVLAVVLAVGLITLGLRMEPHASSKDGSRFTCRFQELDLHRGAAGRWQNGRALLDGEAVRVQRKVLGGHRDLGGPRRVLRRTEVQPKGKAVFLLDGDPHLTLRVPQRSPAAARLDGLVSH